MRSTTTGSIFGKAKFTALALLAINNLQPLVTDQPVDALTADQPTAAAPAAAQQQSEEVLEQETINDDALASLAEGIADLWEMGEEKAAGRDSESVAAVEAVEIGVVEDSGFAEAVEAIESGTDAFESALAEALESALAEVESRAAEDTDAFEFSAAEVFESGVADPECGVPEVIETGAAEAIETEAAEAVETGAAEAVEVESETVTSMKSDAAEAVESGDAISKSSGNGLSTPANTPATTQPTTPSNTPPTTPSRSPAPSPPKRSPTTSVSTTSVDVAELRVLRRRILRAKSFVSFSQGALEFYSLTRWIFEGGSLRPNLAIPDVPMICSKLTADCRKVISRAPLSRPCALIFKSNRKSVLGLFPSEYKCRWLTEQGLVDSLQEPFCPKQIRTLLNDAKVSLPSFKTHSASAAAAAAIPGLIDKADLRPVGVLFRNGDIWCLNGRRSSPEVGAVGKAKVDSWIEKYNTSFTPQNMLEEPYFVNRSLKTAFRKMIDGFNALAEHLPEDVANLFEVEVKKMLPVLSMLPNLQDYLEGRAPALMSPSERCLRFEKFHADVIEKYLFALPESDMPESLLDNFARLYAKFYETFWLEVILPLRRSDADHSVVTAEDIKEALNNAMYPQSTC